jgi:hypothetical protein
LSIRSLLPSEADEAGVLFEIQEAASLARHDLFSKPLLCPHGQSVVKPP